jgi:hypothetical protein
MTDGQSASPHLYRARIWSPWPDFSFLSDDCEFLDVWRPLWREDGPVIYSYNCFWALPEQSLSGPSPPELKIIFYCLIWDSTNLEDQVPVLVPPGTGWQSYTLRALGSLSSPLTTRRATYGGSNSLLSFIRHGSHRKRFQRRFLVTEAMCLPTRYQAAIGCVHFVEPLSRNDRGFTHTDWLKGWMNFSTPFRWDPLLIYLPSSIKTGLGIQKLYTEDHRHTESTEIA